MAITEAAPALKQVIDGVLSKNPGTQSISVFTPVDATKSYANIEVAGYVDANGEGVISLANYPHDPLDDTQARLVDEHLLEIGDRTIPAYLGYIGESEGDGELLRTLSVAELPDCYR